MTTIALIVSLLCTGLYCFWVSLCGLIQIDEEGTRTPAPSKEPEPEPEQPRLTRLGRPIIDIRLRA